MVTTGLACTSALNVTFDPRGVERWDDISVSVIFAEIPDYFRNLEISQKVVN